METLCDKPYTDANPFGNSPAKGAEESFTFRNEGTKDVILQQMLPDGSKSEGIRVGSLGGTSVQESVLEGVWMLTDAQTNEVIMHFPFDGSRSQIVYNNKEKCFVDTGVIVHNDADGEHPHFGSDSAHHMEARATSTINFEGYAGQDIFTMIELKRAELEAKIEAERQRLIKVQHQEFLVSNGVNVTAAARASFEA